MKTVSAQEIRRWRELPDPADPAVTLKNPLLKEYLRELEEHGKRLEKEPTEELSYALFSLYFKTGNRLSYEAEYFHRRSRLVTYGLIAWLYGREEDLDRLAEVIWEVCGEYTWALPAHVHGGLESGQYTVDLFASETAVCLCEMLHYLGRRLPELVVQRAYREVDQRVLLHYEQSQEPFPFEKMENNWCAVCAGSIGMCALYRIEDAERLSGILNRAGKTLDRFLDSFKEDGACLEGLSYWTYGVSFFVSFCELLWRKSGGTLDWMSSQKFHQIAKFQQKCYFDEGRTLSFSDGDTRERYRRGLTSYLCGRYADVTAPEGQCQASYREDSCYRWVTLFRDLIWSGREIRSSSRASCFECLPDAGWWLVHDRKTGIAAKAGCNGEPHNHNDVGHFLLYRGGEELLADLGAGEYTREYFQENTRYQVFCNQSFSHSVPIVNGKGQLAGGEYGARDVEFLKDGIRMDLAQAYEKETVRKLLRTFHYKQGRLIVSDEFIFDMIPETLAERFVTRGRITQEPGRLIFENGRERAVLHYPQEELSAVVTSIPHSNHQGRTELVTAADLIFKNCKIQMKCCLEIE